MSSPPPQMRAIGFRGAGGPEVLHLTRLPTPRPGPGEVLLRVAAAGVNRPDVMQREGHYPPPPGAPATPGLEVAGRVVCTGAGVQSPAPGEVVCALLTGGGYAEYAVAPAVQCLPVPTPLSLSEAAGLPETFFTVWHNVFERGGLGAGEWLLVHGGSSGIGTTAIQLATAFGARVIATAGTAEKCRCCQELGAHAAIDYHNDDFVERTRELTDGRGVDVILDMVGARYLERNIRCLATEGRLVQIAVQAGARAEVNLLDLMLRRLTLTGSTLRARSVEAKGALAESLRRRVWPLLETGAVRPVIHQVFPLERAADAHALMDSGRHMGKIVLELEAAAGG